jgi:hypothetical protein
MAADEPRWRGSNQGNTRSTETPGCAALVGSSVTWKQHVLNHALEEIHDARTPFRNHYI